MKAIVFTEYGSPQHLVLKEVPRPTPGDDEVLVRVHASSVNSWDWEFQSGTSFISRLFMGWFKPKRSKQKLGADIAGTVCEIGKSVTRFKPGDEVFGDLWDRWGGFAEYACAPENALELKPANASFAEAAAVPQAGVLALQGVGKIGKIEPGQTVLINGAGGGVGTFAVQLAKYYGAQVTGVDKAHKLKVVRALGADRVIDYEKEDFTRRGERYDLILDMRGVRSMFDYRRALTAKGTYAMVGGSEFRLLQILLFGVWGAITGGQRFRLVAEGPNAGLSDLRDLIEAGRLAPVIDSHFDLDELPEALQYFAEGRHAGKIAIDIQE